jgi:O-antigen ligase
VLLVVWFGLQILPLPRGMLGLLSPERLTFPAVPAGSNLLPMSLYPGAGLEQGLLHLALLYLVWSLIRSPSRAPFRILAAAGVAHAVLGIVLAETRGTTSTRVLWLYELPEVLTPFGTYVNKNHFAGLMVITGGACLALLARRMAHALRHTAELGFGARLSALTGRGSFRLLVPVLGFLLILLALFASGSRGAALAMVGALAVVSAVVTVSSGRLRPGILVAGTLLVAAVAAAASAGSSVSVLERLWPGGRFLNRPRLWENTLEMAFEYPVCGTGLGTFNYVFPRYQRFGYDRRFTHAEGDWIQYLAEAGLVGFLGLLAFGLLLLRRALRSIRGGGPRAALTGGALVGLVGIALHGLVDISLHIPANMVAASILLGGLLGQLECGGETTPERGREGGLG